MKKALKVGSIMDPISSINYQKDTSYFLLLAAFEKDYEIFHINQNDIFLKNNQVFAFVSPIQVQKDKTFKIQTKKEVDLNLMDLILVRKDPPFDRRYLYTTLILDYLRPKTLVWNKPQLLRDWNEKMVALKFAQYCPPTLIASQQKALEDFIKEQNSRMVIKPLDGRGGWGIKYLDSNSSEIKNTLQKETHNFTKKIVLQRYIPEARKGDLRVLILNGHTLGGFLRKSSPESELNNLDQGGTAHPQQLSSKQREICEKIAPVLKEQGAFFAGLDFLGDFLTEINITSPTGLQELARFQKKPLHHICIEEFIKTKNRLL